MRAHRDGGRPARDVVIAAAAGTAMPSYLALGTVVTGAVQVARAGTTLSSVVGAHCYEHSLDYVLVLLLTMAFAPAPSPCERPVDLSATAARS